MVTDFQGSWFHGRKVFGVQISSNCGALGFFGIYEVVYDQRY